MSTLLFIIIGAISLLGMYAQGRLRKTFKQYSQFRLSSGLSGGEVAAEMLRHYGIGDVKIVQGKGFLSDHYNPLTKTISLSPPVFQGRNIAAASVAAHECGHAVQHNTSYSMLKMRSAFVPIVKAASMINQWLLLAALFTVSTFPSLLLIVIISFAVTTLFSFMTLPVEFDASKRALAWLDNAGVVRGQEYNGAKDALKWAATTYVVAALSSLAMLIYLALTYLNR